MTPDQVMEIGNHAMQLTLVLMFILLVPSLIVGLLVSLVQAATQINEMTLTFIPKLLVTMAVLVFAGPMMLRMLTDYMQQIINSIPSLAGG
jgi:flagellar biosynthetic protein FliQ